MGKIRQFYTNSMPRLLFFSRVALLCNLCFLFAFSMHYLPAMRNGVLPSTVIILGNVLAIVLNTLLNLLFILIFLAGRVKATGVPRWLVITNFFFFVFQAILLIK